MQRETLETDVVHLIERFNMSADHLPSCIVH